MSAETEPQIDTNLADLRGNVSVQDAADAIGITRGNLYNLEAGAYLPTVNTASALSRYFKRPITFVIQPAEKS